MVTHDPNAASYADRVIFLADGQIVDELTAPTADAVLDRLKRLDVTSAAVAASGSGDAVTGAV
jgi:putative ABC transport system ATP-binding protein